VANADFVVQAYDTYIQETRRELEQEFENGNSVKPQIKQPRVAEKTRPLRSDSTESLLSEVKVSEQSKSADAEVKEEISALVSESKLETIQSEVAISSLVVEESEVVWTEEESKSDTTAEEEQSQAEDTSTKVEPENCPPSPVLTSENIPDIPTDKNTTPPSRQDTEEVLSEILKVEETLEVIEETNSELPVSAPSPESQTSVETTIESSRRADEDEADGKTHIVDVESKEDEELLVEDIRKVVDEAEVDKITNCLIKRLLDDTLRSAKRVKETERVKSLQEELQAAAEVKEAERFVNKKFS